MKKLILAALAAAAVALPAAPATASVASPPAGLTADDSARAGVGRCELWHPGYRGVYVWWYDLDNNYHRTNTCIYIGP